MIHLETIKSNLACEIGDAVYQQYKSDVYGISLCKNCSNKTDIKSKRMLKDLVDNYTESLYCDLDKIKDLHWKARTLNTTQDVLKH